MNSYSVYNFKLFLRSLGAILGATLGALIDTRGVKRAAHNVIPNTRQVLHATTAHHDHRVFLELVTFTRDVRRYFNPIAEADAGDFPQRGIRFIGRHCTDIGADTTFLGRTLQLARPFLMKRIKGELQRWRLAFGSLGLTTFADQLVDCGHFPCLRKNGGQLLVRKIEYRFFLNKGGHRLQ